MNIYINELNTKIIKRKYIKDKTHIVLENNIILDYKKYNIEIEKIYINDVLVEDFYNSSLGFAFIVNFKPQTDSVNIRVSYSDRIRLLKSLTLRPIISSTLKKYFNMEANNFYSGLDKSYFDIQSVYFEDDAKLILSNLEKNINIYLNYDLEIQNDIENKRTYIEGLFDEHYMPYTLSSISEIKNFNIESFVFNDRGLRVYYSII